LGITKKIQMNLYNICYCSQTCLFLFAFICAVICNESNAIKTFNDAPNETQNVPFVISVPSQYNSENQEKEMFNTYSSPLEEKLRNYRLSEHLERLRRSSSLLPYETLSGTPSRRSASHPCRWKLCGAHFGYHSMRRF
jgi:hypothetical protein